MKVYMTSLLEDPYWHIAENWSTQKYKTICWNLIKKPTTSSDWDVIYVRNW